MDHRVKKEVCEIECMKKLYWIIMLNSDLESEGLGLDSNVVDSDSDTIRFKIQIYLTIKQTNIQMRNNTKFVKGKGQMKSKLMLVWMAHYNKKNTY